MQQEEQTSQGRRSRKMPEDKDSEVEREQHIKKPEESGKEEVEEDRV